MALQTSDQSNTELNGNGIPVTSMCDFYSICWIFWEKGFREVVVAILEFCQRNQQEWEVPAQLIVVE